MIVCCGRRCRSEGSQRAPAGHPGRRLCHRALPRPGQGDLRTGRAAAKLVPSPPADHRRGVQRPPRRRASPCSGDPLVEHHRDAEHIGARVLRHRHRHSWHVARRRFPESQARGGAATENLERTGPLTLSCPDPPAQEWHEATKNAVDAVVPVDPQGGGDNGVNSVNGKIGALEAPVRTLGCLYTRTRYPDRPWLWRLAGTSRLTRN